MRLNPKDECILLLYCNEKPAETIYNFNAAVQELPQKWSRYQGYTERESDEMSTERDKAILNSILNPFLPVGGDFEIENPSSLNDVIGEVTEEILEAKRIEKEAIVLAEEERILDAIKALSKAIEMAPQLPSLYNNRAQAYRLNNDITNALNDLNTAISLSRGFGRSACQAFCQRGLILKKNGQDEKAMEDFKKAAELGSPFAKMVLVQSNPYAALCNKMLSQVMEKLTKRS